MEYSEFVEVYERLSKTSGRLEKVTILAAFLKKLEKKGKSEWSYLLFGRVFPAYDSREFGISTQLVIKAIAVSYGISEDEVKKRFNKVGDLGEIAEEFAGKKRQSALFSKRLDVSRVFDNLQKVAEVEGKGAVDRKMALISELLANAGGKEAKYIIRTLMSDLRIGVAEGVLRDAVAEAFLEGVEGASARVEEAYDLVNDFAIVLESASKGVKELEKASAIPGRPMKVMLAIKVTSIDEAFEICGKPAAIEQKYDGFRMLLNKDKNGKVSLFTRRLENVTNQFPDVVESVKKYIKAESFILDSEVVGYDTKTKKYLPFEAVSQRIKRKYDIDELVKKLPVEINVFDVIYCNGKSTMELPFTERREIVEKIIDEKKLVIRPAVQIVTDSEEKAQEFYEESLKIGEEGIMVKSLKANYKSGRRVGYMVKMKPEVRDIDLVIVGAEHGTGKRGGWLSSYIVACNSAEGLLEIGKVSSGLKELKEQGTTYEEMTKLLKPLIIEEKGNEVKVKPKIVVSVTYQNIQKSPSYNSGYAMRFPRITNYRPDRRVDDITTIEEIEKEVRKNKRK